MWLVAAKTSCPKFHSVKSEIIELRKNHHANPINKSDFLVGKEMCWLFTLKNSLPVYYVLFLSDVSESLIEHMYFFWLSPCTSSLLKALYSLYFPKDFVPITVKQTRKRKPEIYLNQRRDFREVKVHGKWRRDIQHLKKFITLFNGALWGYFIFLILI